MTPRLHTDVCSVLRNSPPASPWGLLRLRKLLEKGLPLTPRPFQTLAEQAGLSEAQVMDAVDCWQKDGLIKRMGLVVQHRTLGYRANAMVVWDIPDEQVNRLGRQFADIPFVTLCYQRPRRLPDWPYNLFCMIPGVSRDRVEGQIDELIRTHQLQECPHAVLFSSKAYRQRGGCYVGSD
jgi:DNA-binding Lrp family transcriptional regulator